METTDNLVPLGEQVSPACAWLHEEKDPAQMTWLGYLLRVEQSVVLD